ncbi:LOW QUALITY PROTEIN: uncharacterized protein LOC134154699, partial [Rhea pennata]|uniref:LOW QUALITY PROTEIN: uncharacterized protein LOC134154699 n=1 Tax=Rhea pennata TaxID=8795 RepID=UPI002E26433D
THEFLSMPECPLPLLGRDLLCKLNAQVTFSESSVQLHSPPESAWRAQICLLMGSAPDDNSASIPSSVLDAVIPLVWASTKPGKAKNATPVKIELQPGAKPVRVHQYPIKLEARRGLEPLINAFLQYGLLRECQSEFNTPILPVRKPHSQEYRLVQDLRAVNQITEDIHPSVPNPYTLLASVPETNNCFTVRDLKDAFFCIPIEEQSQTIFTFEWESPTTRRKEQLCWMVLPLGFKDSPTVFGEILAKELAQWQEGNKNVTLLQYVDDILSGADSEQICLEATVSLFNFLGLAGYRVSKKKAQIAKKEVQYLGLTPGEHWQIDFSQLPKCGRFKDLLVLVDTFSGWPEAFPCSTNRAKEVIKILLKEIVPRFVIPEGISSDNGPHFISEVVQGTSRFLQMKWELHTPCRLQSSGKVERMNQTLKRHISRLCQETHLKWVDVLPMALMRIRITPRIKKGVSPFETLYGKPY